LTYTLRRASPGENRPDDFVIRHDGRDVGRLYRSTFAREVRWQWSIYIIDNIRRVDGVPISALAESLQEAKAQFKVSFERMVAVRSEKEPA
jgi:hypothetical protein